jgi:4-hydroxybenzoate polyprenyltransferase
MFAPDLKSTGKSVLAGIWYELRPHQWYKQVLLFVPLVFSGQATSLTAWSQVIAGALVFSLLAGCVYIVNDIFDREEDRNHPIKQHRPIASGQVSVRIAKIVAIGGFLIVGGVALWLDWVLFLILVGYLVQNLVYSTILKNVFLIDIFIIGSGFVLRAIAGVAIISAPSSPWLLLTVFLAALLLASGKRRAEFKKFDNEARTSLDNFTEEFSMFLLFLSATTLLVVYSLYTFFSRSTIMMLTIPFAYYSVLKFCYLMLEQPTEQVHEHLFRRDMLAVFTLWGVATLIILYTPVSL